MSAPTQTMLAAVLNAPGPADSFDIKQVPIPTPKPGWVLIKVKATGMNRAEMYTRQGLSGPLVPFPKIIGTETTGIIEDPNGSARLSKGDIVAAMGGGMGRAFDGGYAEYVTVPEEVVRKINIRPKDVDWSVLAAIPATFQTAWGCTQETLRLKKEDRLLIRGGTMSLGLAVAGLAKEMGVSQIVSTTRSPDRIEMLKKVGVHDVIIEKGPVMNEEVSKRYPQKFTKIIEGTGATTLEDSLKCCATEGIVCFIGMVAGEWIIKGDFDLFSALSKNVFLTRYSSSVETFMACPLDQYYDDVKSGKIYLPIKTYLFKDIKQAHQDMEDSKAAAKIVLLM